MGGVPFMSGKSTDQVKKFREVARELECDESIENFDAKLKAVAKHAPTKAGRPSEKKDSRD
jgi:hypothetical protein